MALFRYKDVYFEIAKVNFTFLIRCYNNFIFMNNI